MKNEFKVVLLFIFALVLAMGCSSEDNNPKMVDDDVSQTDDDPTPTDDDPTPGEGYEMVDVQVVLPEDSNVDTIGASLFGLGTASDLEGSAKGVLPFNPGTVELAYLFSADDELLLAGFLTDDRKEISVSTTAEVMLYFGMLTSLRTTPYKRLFVENIGREQAFMVLAAEFETLFKQNPKVFAEGGFMGALNEAITALTSKETINIGSKIDFSPIESSGLSLNEVGEQSFTVSNSYPRRTHGYVYKKSYKNEFGEETIINSEIGGNDIADHELEIPFVALADENKDNLQSQVLNFNLCSQGAQYITTTSPELNLELVEGRTSETYELAIVGPGRGTAMERQLTDAEQEKLEELSIETFVMDYFLPILMDIGGNRDIYEAKALQEATSMVGTVEPILRAHEPSITAVWNNDFEAATKEFLPFLYGDIRLSNDLRNIMSQLYGIISEGNGPNTFIQKNELIQEGEQRYLKLSNAILRSIKESVGVNCINQRLGISTKLEKWDITISEGLVKLKPESVETVPFSDAKIINALVFFDLEAGQELEYEWGTTTQFGGKLYDYVDDQNGTTFTSSSNTVSFISTASSSALGDGDNLEEVSVTVYLKDGTSRDELGSATMMVNVKKNAFVIRPGNITIGGKDILDLNLVHGDGQTTIPNADTEYKVVWSTSGNHGLLNGLSTSLTTLDSGSMTYQANDTEVESATETVSALIYARPRGSDMAYQLMDRDEATITIENEENVIYLYPQAEYHLYDHPSGVGYGYIVFFQFSPVANAESYSLRVKELQVGNNSTSFVNSGKTWVAGNEDDLTYDSREGHMKNYYRYETYYGSGPDGQARADAAAILATTKGFAQVKVVLKPE